MATSTTTEKTPKTLLKELPLFRLYVVMFLSFLFFLGELILAHIAHSLTLQVDSYHMLYNILALGASIAAAKMSKKGSSLKNTFGWTRIDVCGTVASLCFLAALSFSLVIEALQALFHSTHHERMHYSLWVGAMGIIGIPVNFLAWAIIGGYSHHQQRCLKSHSKGGVNIRVSPINLRTPEKPKISYGSSSDVFRDFFGSICVIACAAILSFWDKEESYFVDPAISIAVAILHGISLYSHAREAGYILLLTIPNGLDVDSLVDELHEKFPEIYDVHEFHVWQLNPSKVIASAHIVLKETKDCWLVQNRFAEFMQGKGISHVTIQPEFQELIQIRSQSSSPDTLCRRKCFLPCKESENCLEKKCCVEDPVDAEILSEVKTSHHSRSLQNVSISSHPMEANLNKSHPELSATFIKSTETADERETIVLHNLNNEEIDSSEEELQPMIRGSETVEK